MKSGSCIENCLFNALCVTEEWKRTSLGDLHLEADRLPPTPSPLGLPAPVGDLGPAPRRKVVV